MHAQTQGSSELRLPASPRSASAARRHVRHLLTTAGRADWSEAAELAVSEVVTNAVLHAHTALVLRVAVLEDEALIEVEDGSPGLPTQRVPPSGTADEATTGRGLALLTAVTRSRGVRATATGKTVWFTVGRPDGSPGEVPDGEELASLEGGDAARLDPPSPDGAREVALLAMPALLWIAARDHHQSLLRELVLHLAEHPDAAPPSLDLTAADAARSLVWTTLVAALEREHGGPHLDHSVALDLHMPVLPDRSHEFLAFQDAVDLAERLAEQDLLLARPGLPEIAAVRDWACEQVVAQLGGVPPRPWPGADQQRFAADRVEVSRSLPEDIAAVTQSPHAVLAADEANRVLAVSPAFAALVGWEPAELVGRRVVTLVPPRLREAHVVGFTRHLTTGQSRLLGRPLALPVLHADGRELPCTVWLERRTTAGRPVYLARVEAAGS